MVDFRDMGGPCAKKMIVKTIDKMTRNNKNNTVDVVECGKELNELKKVLELIKFFEDTMGAPQLVYSNQSVLEYIFSIKSSEIRRKVIEDAVNIVEGKKVNPLTNRKTKKITENLARALVFMHTNGGKLPPTNGQKTMSLTLTPEKQEIAKWIIQELRSEYDLTQVEKNKQLTKSIQLVKNTYKV